MRELFVGAAQLGPVVTTMERLRLPRPSRRGKALVGAVLWVDGFGNATTNISDADLARAGFRGSRLSITIAGHVVPFRSSYAAVPPGRVVALVNSADRLEIAVNAGSASVELGAGVGVAVRVEVA